MAGIAACSVMGESTQWGASLPERGRFLPGGTGRNARHRNDKADGRFTDTQRVARLVSTEGCSTTMSIGKGLNLGTSGSTTEGGGTKHGGERRVYA
jgi:hypothetical protein